MASSSKPIQLDDAYLFDQLEQTSNNESSINEEQLEAEYQMQIKQKQDIEENNQREGQQQQQQFMNNNGAIFNGQVNPQLFYGNQYQQQQQNGDFTNNNQQQFFGGQQFQLNQFQQQQQQQFYQRQVQPFNTLNQDYTIPPSLMNNYYQNNGQLSAYSQPMSAQSASISNGGGLRQVRMKSGIIKNMNKQQQLGSNVFGKRNNSRPQSAQIARFNNQLGAGVQSTKGPSALGLIQNQQLPQFNNFYKQLTGQKDQNYEDQNGLRLERNKLQTDNIQLKTQLKVQERELKRKDTMIKQLMDRLNQETFTQAQLIQIQNLSEKQQIAIKYKQKIKQLKNDLLIKQEEIMNLNRNIKFTKIGELETEINQLTQEIQRLNQALVAEVNKPRIDPSAYQTIQLELQKQQIILKQSQDQASQLVTIIQDKELLISKRDRKISNMNERLKLVREKVRNQAKKIKVLTNKFMEQERDKVGFISKMGTSGAGGSGNNWRGRNNNQLTNHNESLRTKRSNSGGSPRNGGSPQRSKKQREADWFEKFVIEKTKNERLINRLKKYDSNIDINQVYQEEQRLEADNGQDQQPTTEDEQNRIIQVIYSNEAKTFPFTTDFDVLKALIAQEFELQQDLNFILKDKNDEEITDIKRAVDGGDAYEPLIVIVQIQDEKYEEEDFDEYVENYVDAIKQEEAQPLLLEIKLKLQIKKIKSDRALKYILRGLNDENYAGKKIKLVCIQKLSQQLVKKFKLSDQDATIVARFIIEEPNQNQQVIFNIQKEISRGLLKKKLKNTVGDYPIYNGLAVTSMLNRLTSILEDSRSIIEDKLMEFDKKEVGEVTLQQFQKVLIQANAPQLDEDMMEFMLYITLRQSNSLKKINYYAFMEIFDEDYLLQASPHEDKLAFEDSSDTSEDEQKPNPSGIPGQDLSNRHEAADIQINSEDLMLEIDEVIKSITDQMQLSPEQSQSSKSLTKQLFPRIREVLNVQSIDENKQIYYIISDDFQNFIKSLLGWTQLPLSTDLEKKVQCLLHVLIRDDLQGVILYDEFKALISNFLKKERAFRQSIQMGVRYDLINEEILQFLQNVKALTVDDQETGAKGKSLTDLLRAVITQQKTLNAKREEKFVSVADFENVLDHLFMKFSIRCPPMKVQSDLKLLLCIDSRFQDLVLINKFERILHELDQIQVNLIKLLKFQDYKDKVKKLLPSTKPPLQNKQPFQISNINTTKEKMNNQKSTKDNSKIQKGVSFQQDSNQQSEFEEDHQFLKDIDEDVEDSYQEESNRKKKNIPQKDDKVISSRQNQNKIANKQQDEKPLEKEEFKFDYYRKKFTKVAEEVPSDIDDDYEEDEEEEKQAKVNTKSNTFKNQTQQNILPASNYNQKLSQQKVTTIQPNNQQQTQLKTQSQQNPNNGGNSKNQTQKQQDTDNYEDQDYDESDKEAIKEEKMDFQYDPYRKKYTVKAEEVEEDVEEDFIEDNYDI